MSDKRSASERDDGAADPNPAPLKERRRHEKKGGSSSPSVKFDASAKGSDKAEEPSSSGADAAAKPTAEATAAALSYLRLWDSDRKAWKFNKIRQNFLLKWALDPEVVGKSDFPLVLKYFGPLKGGAKELLLQAVAAELALEPEKPSDEADPAQVLRMRIARVRGKRARKLQRLLR